MLTFMYLAASYVEDVVVDAVEEFLGIAPCYVMSCGGSWVPLRPH